MSDTTEKGLACARVLVQIVVMIPSCLWCMMSVRGAYAHARMGWYSPVVCFGISIIVCLLILRSLWKRARELRELFKIRIDLDDLFDAEDDDIVVLKQLAPRGRHSGERRDVLAGLLDEVWRSAE